MSIPPSKSAEFREQFAALGFGINGHGDELLVRTGNDYPLGQPPART